MRGERNVRRAGDGRVSFEGPRGGLMNRTYELSSDGKQLIVTSKIQTPRMDQPVSIRFVYDPAKPASGSGTSQ